MKTRQLLLGGLVLGLIVTASAAEAQPAISIDPNPIGFGGSGMLYLGGQPGETQFAYAAITNAGTATLTVTNLTITGADAGLMAFDDPSCPSGTSCPGTFTLAPGENRGFSLTCVAAQPGTFSAQLTVTSDAASGTSSVPVTCVGLHPPELEVTPGGLDFGTAHSCWYGDSCGPSCNTRPLTQTLTITNTAPAPSEVDISMVLPPSAPWEDFTIAGDPGWPAPLAAGESIQLTFAFHPRYGRTQFYDAPLTVTPTYPADQAPIEVPFHAHGGGGELVIDTPQQLGIVPIGETLVTTITAHNAGNSCLDLSEIYGAGDLTILEPTSPNVFLQSGESFTWTVACTSNQLPTLGGELSFWTKYEAADMARVYPFYCHSPTGALYGEPAQLALEAGLGASVTERLSVTNVGNEPTELVALTSSDPHFTVALASGSLPVTLGPGDETEVDVTFTPAEAGRVSGKISLAASIGTGFTVSVTGDGVVLAASVSPPSHDFGAVALPAAPGQDFELRNTGERPLTVNGASLDLPDYEVTGLAAGATIDPGATHTFTVTATPSMLGHRPAVLTIDLDRAADLAVPLDMLASDPALVVTTEDETPDDNALELGSVDLGEPRIRRIGLHNASLAAITLATCAVTGAPAFTLAEAACPTTIEPGAGAELAIAFAPSVAADAVAGVTITGTGFATGALQLDLHGTGVDEPEPPHGGCSTTGGAVSTLPLALGFAWLVRRRRR